MKDIAHATGGDLGTLLDHDRQQRSEAHQAEQLTGLSKLLLPTALALARLSARNAVERTAR